ncbi:MAG TPA: nucleoside recognition domain-containing protein [Limnochordales bacterium]
MTGSLFVSALGAGLKEAAMTVLTMAAIVIPLMVAVEFLREWRVFDRLSARLEPGAGRLGLSGNAAFPLAAGAVLGLSYGSGLIIASAREGRLTRREAYVLTALLGPCHAIFEDTLLFVPLGVNPFLLLGVRAGGALALALVLARLWRSTVEPTGPAGREARRASR